jgi:hypothetical protein
MYITSKSRFFASIFEDSGKLKSFLRCNAGGIWIKIHLNPKSGILDLLLEVS